MVTTITRRTILHMAGAGAGASLAACGGTAGQELRQRQIAESVTLDFQHRWQSPRYELTEQLVRDFAAVQPNIKINNQMVLSTGAGTYDGMPTDKWIAQIAAGTPPDVIMMRSDLAVDWGARGVLRPLDDLLKRDRMALDQVFYPTLAKMARYREKTNGLPHTTPGGSPMIFIGNGAYQAAGLGPKRPPQHWDDLVEHSQKLTERQGEGFNRVGINAGSFHEQLTLNAGRLLSDDGTKVAFDSPEGIETLQWMVDFMNRVYGGQAKYDQFLVSVRGTGNAAGRVPWYQGQVGLWYTSPLAFFYIKNESPTYAPNFQYTPLLAVPNSSKNPRAKRSPLAAFFWLYSIPAGTKQADAAWEWVKYITAGDGGKRFLLSQGRPSPVIKHNDDPEYTTLPHWDVAKQTLTDSTPMIQTPAWPSIDPVLSTMTRRALAGEIGVRQGLAAAAEEAQRHLNEVRR